MVLANLNGMLFWAFTRKICRTEGQSQGNRILGGRNIFVEKEQLHNDRKIF